MYKNIIFDFDGTIYDTSLGIINAAKYTLNEIGIDYSKINLRKFTGPPLQDTFKNLWGLEDKENSEAINIFRKYYKSKGVYESVLYDGIENVIKTLKKENYRLFIASSKPTFFIEELLSKCNLTHYFEYISGSPIDGKAYSKEKVLSKVIKTFNLKPDETIMIGDTKYDIMGAKKYQIDSIGVAYCIETYDDLYKQEPTFIARDTLDILKILL